jgi:hypothetical protein
VNTVAVEVARRDRSQLIAGAGADDAEICRSDAQVVGGQVEGGAAFGVSARGKAGNGRYDGKGQGRKERCGAVIRRRLRARHASI